MSGRDELLEAASFLEVHGVLPEELATPAVRAVVTPLMPGDRVDIVVALQVAAERSATS